MKMKPIFGVPQRFTSIEKANVILVYDSLNLFFSCVLHKYLGSLVDGKGRPSSHIFGVFNRIRGHAKRYTRPGQRVALCFAWDGYPKAKYEIHSEYKMNRDSSQTLSTKEQTWRLAAFRNFLSHMPCTFLDEEDNEADDVIASLVSNSRKPITVFSSDKDLWQLLAHKRVRIVSLRQSAETTEDDLRLSYNIHSRKQAYKIALYKAVMGDTSDNIPKVPRIPTKAFHEAIHPLSYRQDEVDCVNLLLDSASNLAKPRAYKLLTEHETLVRRNLELVTLKTDVNYTSTFNTGSQTRLEETLADYDCNSILQGGQYEFLYR